MGDTREGLGLTGSPEELRDKLASKVPDIEKRLSAATSLGITLEHLDTTECTNDSIPEHEMSGLAERSQSVTSTNTADARPSSDVHNRIGRQLSIASKSQPRHRKPSLSAGEKDGIGRDEIYENQRRGLFEGFKQGELLATDSPHYSDVNGSALANGLSLDRDCPAPQGWYWAEDWVVDKEEALYDADGWEYAVTWGSKVWHTTCKPSHCVRRRRWVRTRLSGRGGSRQQATLKKSNSADGSVETSKQIVEPTIAISTDKDDTHNPTHTHMSQAPDEIGRETTPKIGSPEVPDTGDSLTLDSLATDLRQTLSPSPTMMQFFDTVAGMPRDNTQASGTLDGRDRITTEQTGLSVASHQRGPGQMHIHSPDPTRLGAPTPGPSPLKLKDQAGGSVSPSRDPSLTSVLGPLTDQELQFLAMEPHMEQQKLLEEAMQKKGKREQKEKAGSKISNLFKRNPSALSSKDSGGTTIIERTGSVGETKLKQADSPCESKSLFSMGDVTVQSIRSSKLPGTPDLTHHRNGRANSTAESSSTSPTHNAPAGPTNSRGSNNIHEAMESTEHIAGMAHTHIKNDRSVTVVGEGGQYGTKEGDKDSPVAMATRMHSQHGSSIYQNTRHQEITHTQHLPHSTTHNNRRPKSDNHSGKTQSRVKSLGDKRHSELTLRVDPQMKQRPRACSSSSEHIDGTLSDDGGRVASSFATSEWLPGDRGSDPEQNMSQKTMPMRSHSSLNVRDVTKNGHGWKDTGVNDEQNQRKVSGKAAEVKITVYENQRSGLFGAYSTMWLVPGMDKRGQWSLKDGTQSIALDQQKLSPGWEWTGDWTYNKNPEKYDSEGWQYAFSFWTSTWFNRPKAASYVRRRKWTRVRRMILSSYDSSKDIGSNGLSRYASQIDVASKSGRGMPARSSVKTSSSINLRSREPQAGTFAPVAPTQPSRVVVVHIDWTHCVLLMLAVLFTVVSLVAQLEMSRTWSTAVPSMSDYTIRAVHFTSEWTGANSR